MIRSALVVLLCGCSAGGDVLFVQSFEGCKPCGSARGAGAVDIVETTHPAEHAVVLDGEITLELDADIALEAGHRYVVGLSTNCRQAGSDALEAVLAGAVLEIHLPPENPFSWIWMHYFELALEPTAAVRVKRIDLVNRGRGICGVDQLVVLEE